MAEEPLSGYVSGKEEDEEEEEKEERRTVREGREVEDEVNLTG